MFEHEMKPHPMPARGAPGGRALRLLAWEELVARFDAARQLRREWRRSVYLGGASFADAAAGFLSSRTENETPINQEISSLGKQIEGIGTDTEPQSTPSQIHQAEPREAHD